MNPASSLYLVLLWSIITSLFLHRSLAEMPPKIASRVEFKELEVSTGPSGKSDFIHIDIPESAISFHLSLMTSSKENGLIVEHIETPDGLVVVGENPPEHLLTEEVENETTRYELFRDQALSLNRVLPGFGGMVSALFPNSPEVEFKPGRWRFKVASVRKKGEPVADHINIRAAIKYLDAESSFRGVLPIHLYFVGTRPLTAANAPDDLGFQKELRRLKAIYRKVGVTINIESYNDIPEFSFSEKVVQSMFELFTKGRHSRGICIFLTGSEFMDPVLGLSPITGPALLAGSIHSGVLVLASPRIRRYPKALGTVIAHEIGHYLGLFHATERSYDFLGFRDYPNLMFPGRRFRWKDEPNEDIVRQYTRLGIRQVYTILRHPCVELLTKVQ